MSAPFSLPERYREIETLSRTPDMASLHVYDKITDSEFVVRRLDAPSWMNPTESERHLSRIEQTIRPFTDVSSDCLASLLSVDRMENSLVLVREYVQGIPLTHLFENRWHLTEDEARRISDDVSSGLESIAAAGLAHGAVTGENIIVGPDGRFCLTDAGITNLAASFKLAGASCSRTRREAPRDLEALEALVLRALTGCPDGKRVRFGSPFARRPRVVSGSLRRTVNRFDLTTIASNEAAAPTAQAPTASMSTGELFRQVWKPAAAAGILAALATAGGNAVSESRRAGKNHGRWEAKAPTASEIATPDPVLLLDADDSSALRAAVRRQGTAILSNPAVAELFDLSGDQNLRLAACLAAHRNRVGQIVESAASGSQVKPDTAMAMAALKAETEKQTLAILTSSQRLRWESLAAESERVEPIN